MIRVATRAKIINPKDLGTIRYSLPKSWTNAIGILKGRSIDGMRYQRRMRAEWEKRLKRQVRLGRVRHDH